MIKNEIYERLNKVFQDVFDDESIVVNENTTSADIEEWDSLEHINLVVAVESEFGMKFTLGETTSMKNVGEMVTIIANRATK
ncbi:acyl carrier protein [Anaeromassilibacillus sp. An200]|uniref:acyl carrier protein n=1 Tax=Anaeromassilibacillus sp. An200 TaxID=1965587 RepID=UPI000B370383|nr:acyl carrier protein [Anaeromassilibacillus sp. An200]OUP09873.1 acyl carrier protein [Anaeromassilibacillus sp. An200]